MTNQTWTDWVHLVTEGASAREIADKIGGANTTVSRWLREGIIPAEAAISVARAYDADVVQALVASGWLTEQDVDKSATMRRVRAAPALQLVEELMRREVERQVRADTGPIETTGGES